MVKIDSFRGAHRFLSNFHSTPVTLDGVTYHSAEAAFQASKTLDPTRRAEYAAVKNPLVVKRMGRREQLRPDWEQVAYDVMGQVVRAKFADSELARQLLDTGDALLVEGNRWHDNRWGSCSCQRCSGVQGQNWLGRILMEVRDELRGKEV